MPGGLLNIISIGNANVFLTGNPSKTFFNVTYSKYTNFGLQKIRTDYDGLRELRSTTDSVFTFKIKRYAELLMDTYLVVNLPDIWSPVYNPTTDTNDLWGAYCFRWIKNLGTLMIRSVEITCGSLMLQRYSGEYLAAMVDRDFSAEKKDLYNKMTGNVSELYDPANAFGRINTYPSTYFNPTDGAPGAEPSIRGRTLYIPINTWFTLNSNCAFPLIALQYNELVITVTMRPIQELFQVRDVFSPNLQFPYMQPDFNKEYFNMYRFLQTPPAADITTQSGNYQNMISTWNADIHLMSTYCFLSKEESIQFAKQDQVYLIKDVFQYDFNNVVGSTKVKLPSNGMISNWMFFFQRNDVNVRNEWSNYTNWPYLNSLPHDIFVPVTLPVSKNPNGYSSQVYITGPFAPANQKEILVSMAIVFDGDYRENVLLSGIYNYVEKYMRTVGSATEGMYCYNYCINTSPFEYQPSGAINLSKFRTVELEITTYLPPTDPQGAMFNVVCAQDGTLVGVSNKPAWQLYYYTYNLTVMEERYNVLSFVSGNCGMLYSR